MFNPPAQKGLDPEHYFRGKQSIQRGADDPIPGRREGDAEKLFPKYSHAAAAVTGEVLIGGKPLKLWTTAQLETLSAPILRQRAIAIRDVVGEAQCPPMPSGRPAEMVRWIMQMQSELTNEAPQHGQAGYGAGHSVLQPFTTQNAERPDTAFRAPPSPLQPASRHGADLTATREQFHNQQEYEQGPAHGVSSGPPDRAKKHILPKNNMDAAGISTIGEVGIGSLRAGGEGRRYFRPEDHIMAQKQQMVQGYPSTASRPARPTSPGKHVSDSSLTSPGVIHDEAVEAPIMGDRRRRVERPDTITGAVQQDPRGRKYLDCFAGARPQFKSPEEGQSYQSTWKKDPVKLKGSSLII